MAASHTRPGTSHPLSHQIASALVATLVATLKSRESHLVGIAETSGNCDCRLWGSSKYNDPLGLLRGLKHVINLSSQLF
ncbi:hypothetical protein L208DRAFT_1389226 [Tricholoma matsutake]|nr:hypothetical protein L208DRAFT_1389226 [Tricholoma matsutake 945]